MRQDRNILAGGARVRPVQRAGQELAGPADPALVSTPVRVAGAHARTQVSRHSSATAPLTARHEWCTLVHSARNGNALCRIRVKLVPRVPALHRRSRFDVARLQRQVQPHRRALSEGNSRDMTVGLALSGGGTRGSFQLGAIKYLYEEWGVRPDVIVGTSVGALNGLMLAHGHTVGPLEAAWRSLTRNEDMYVEQPWLRQWRQEFGDTPDEWAAAIRAVVAPASITFASAGVAAVFFAPLAIGLLMQAGQRLQRLADRISEFASRSAAAPSIYSLDPLRDLAERAGAPWRLDIARVQESGIELRLAMVSLESGQVHYVDQNGYVRGTNEGAGPFHLLDAALASAGIPGVFPAVTLGEHTYVDGGVREVVPIRGAFEAGADLVYAISCSKIGADYAPSFRSAGFPDIAKRAVMDLLPDEILRSEMTPDGAGWRGTVIPISPDWNVNDSMTINPHNIALAIDYGWMQAADAMRRFDPGRPSEKAASIDPAFAVRARDAERMNFLEPVLRLADSALPVDKDIVLLGDDVGRGYFVDSGYVLTNTHISPWDIPEFVEKTGTKKGESSSSLSHEIVNAVEKTDEVARFLANVGRAAPSVEEDSEDLRARLAHEAALRPRTRSEQLSTEITVIRQELVHTVQALTIARGRGGKTIEQPRISWLLSVIPVLRSQLAAAVQERASLGGALPPDAGNWHLP